MIHGIILTSSLLISSYHPQSKLVYIYMYGISSLHICIIAVLKRLGFSIFAQKIRPGTCIRGKPFKFNVEGRSFYGFG